MITSLRIFFLNRVLREKLLLVAFVAIGAVIWISSYSSRMGSFWRAMNSTTAQLKDQDKWLKDQTRIDAEAQKAAAKLDPAQTLKDLSLFTTVQQLARDAGLTGFRGDRGAAPSPTGRFTFSTLRVTITMNEANGPKNWEAVKKFYISLQQRSPYITIDKFALQPFARNTGQLTLVADVSALQILH